MVKSADTFIALNQVLDNQETDVIKATEKLTEIKVITGERAEVRASIESLLKQRGIPIVDGKHGGLTRKVGSFGGTEIKTDDETIRLIYKQKGNKGSGGGAEATRLTESAQCVYTAIAFGLGREIDITDITPQNVSKYSGEFNVDENVNNILNNLPEEWISSSLLGANKLYKKFRSGSYVFHRGSSTVDAIENAFKRVKKNESVRMDINKWNPADIWMVSNKFSFDALNKERTILGVNQVIQEKLEEETLIGVSLKKIVGNANISVKNIFRDMKTCKYYNGYEYGKTSKDAYILLTGGTKIQYRTFGGEASLTGFQGEVKGSQANQGKISLGPTNMILRNHGLATVPTNAASRVKNEPGQVFLEITAGLKKYAKMSNNQIADLRTNKKVMTPSFLYSKLQATQLLDIITGIKNKDKVDQVVEDLYLYASSQSKYSSAYYKLE